MNLTLSVDEALVERAREVARRHGKSLNEMVREYLESLAGEWTGEQIAAEFERLWDEEPLGDSGGWKFNREELYEERLNRPKPTPPQKPRRK